MNTLLKLLVIGKQFLRQIRHTINRCTFYALTF